MRLFELHSLLYSSFLLLAVIPCLLFFVFVVIGRQERERNLKTLFQKETKVSDLFNDPTAQTDLPLSDFLGQRYGEEHKLLGYLLPLVVFYLVYLLGLYWSFIGMGFILEPDKEIWTPTDSIVLKNGVVGFSGFLGSGLTVLWHIFWRTMRADIKPHTFTNLTIRLVASPILAIVICKGIFFSIEFQNVLLLIAFGSGLLTEKAFRFVEKRWWEKITGKKEFPDGYLPLRNLQGITRNDELRLWEEGIADSQHLAIEKVEWLLLNTNYSLERIIDWKDQAFLYIYVREELPKWQEIHARGAMDILGLAPKYFGVDKHDAMCKAIAKSFQKDEVVVSRFIDTIFQDPRVHQLWEYLKAAYPTKFAESIVPTEIQTGLVKEPEGLQPDAPSTNSENSK